VPDSDWLAALRTYRSHEIFCATWPEINFKAKFWIIPKERMRMKDKKEHRAPLSNEVIYSLEPIQGKPNSKALFFLHIEMCNMPPDRL